jgi:flagellar motility protein MotE (MotC chaperone)
LIAFRIKRQSRSTTEFIKFSLFALHDKEDQMSSREKAQEGLKRIKSAMLAELKSSARGMKNQEIAKALGLESNMRGKHENYLTWSILGLLEAEGKVV